MTDWLIVSDLDGTLLDDDYLNASAGAAIDSVTTNHAGAYVALASSKTPAEMIELVRHCDTDPILIFENGSGMAWRESVLCRPGPESVQGYELERYGTPYPQVVNILRALRFDMSYPFRGFSDMTPEEVAAATGLSHSEAERARQRLCSEPIVWEGDTQQLADFDAALAERGLQRTQGGRFHHIGSSLSKGRALKKLWRLLRFQFGIHATTVACGDAPNDLGMMECADHAVVFPGRSGTYLQLDNPNTLRAPVAGAAAWQAAVSDILDGYRQGASAT